MNGTKVTPAAQQQGGCLARIRTHYPSLSPAEQRVADQILSMPEEVLRTPISNLARRCSVSDATVFRFSQTLGYNGFPQLKAALTVDLLTPGSIAAIQLGDTMGDIVHKLITLATQGLRDTFTILGPHVLEQAASTLCAAPTIEVYGVGGSSGPMAEIAGYRFLTLGLSATGVSAQELMLRRASMLQPGDVAFGITHSGVAVPVVEALRVAREQGATTICLTNYARSPVTHVADLVLQTAALESPRQSEAVTTRMLQLAVLDALYSGVALIRLTAEMAWEKR
jgi:RpiR family carbohydrate utilization transcriptional regulator